MARVPEVWTDSLGLGHASIPLTGDMGADMATARELIAQLNIVTNAPIVFERITGNGTAVYGHSLTQGK